MRKLFLILVVFLTASTVLMAQATPPDYHYEFNSVYDAGAMSIEAATTNYLFDSDIDNYIDPAFYDAGIGSFLFTGAGVDTGDTGAEEYALSFGYGKTMAENAYLGLFYAGTVVDDGTEGFTGDNPTTGYYGNTIWKNNIALLLGLAGMGFRLDIIMDDFTLATADTGGVATRTYTNAPSLSLFWGTALSETFYPYARVGFKLPAVTTYNDKNNKRSATNTTESAIFGLLAGFWAGLTDTTSVIAEASVEGIFGTGWSKDSVWAGGSADGYSQGGQLGISLYGSWTKDVAIGQYAMLKISPNASLAFESEHYNRSDRTTKAASAEAFSFLPALDFALAYNYDKIGLYTGFTITCFELIANWFTGGDTKNPNSGWVVDGITWIGAQLQFGMTFAPVEGLSIGAKLGFAPFNVARVYFNPLYFPTYGGAANNGNVNGQLTISYKY
jgi:hypothetical protein